jgi:hypothetical protein
MKAPVERLWPFGKGWAIGIIPITWVLFIVIFSLSGKYLDWPDQDSRATASLAVLLLSLIPFALVLLDFLASKGAKLDLKGFKIDFSHITLDSLRMKRESVALPENMGVAGRLIRDTRPLQIASVLEKATANKIAQINIEDGNAWWVTRLLALAVGGVKTGSMEAIVFLGKKGGVEKKFLGWARPHEVQEAIIKANKNYRVIYESSLKVARQVETFQNGKLGSNTSNVNFIHKSFGDYVNDPSIKQLSNAAVSMILMDQMSNPDPDNPELKEFNEESDRLTLSRLNDLFGHCLYMNSVDAEWSNDKKVSKFLEYSDPLMAVVRDGTYESMIRTNEVLRVVVKELFFRLQKEDENN